MKSVLDKIKEKEGIDLSINKNLQEKIIKSEIDVSEKSSGENNNDDWRNNFFE